MKKNRLLNIFLVCFSFIIVSLLISQTFAISGTRLLALGKKIGTVAVNLTLLAGQYGGPGYADATGSAAQFNSPRKLAVDASGNVFVADETGNRIRKITSAGVVTTFAGPTTGLVGASGTTNGTGSAARVNGPWGLAKDTSGNLYLADRLNSQIRTITNPGAVVADLSGGAISFPTGVAVDGSGNVYTTDSWQVYKISGGIATVLAGGGGSNWINGTGAAAGFNWIGGLTYDSTCNCLYIADTQNNAIRKVTLPGGVVTTIAGGNGTACTSSGCNAGNNDGTGTAAGFNFPYDVTTDTAGNIFVADQGNCTIRKVTPAGVTTTFAGTAYACGNVDATGAAAQFGSVSGLASDGSNNIYVSDIGNMNIRKISSGGVVTTLAGPTGVTSGDVDATGSSARFNYIVGISVDSAGNVFATDSMNHKIKKITSGGVATTFAGSGVLGNADGTGTGATFQSPMGLFIDISNNLWVGSVNACTIRKVTNPGAVVTFFAGTLGDCSSANGTGATAKFNYPMAITGDASGNLFVVDINSYDVRKVTSGAVSTLLAGGSYGYTEGTGAAAQFSGMYSTAIDSSGNVFVSDNSNCLIRKITPAGVTSAFAGTSGNCSFADGTGAAAMFTYPKGIAIDSSDNIYVADEYNHVIRKITPARVVTTVVGVPHQNGVILGSSPGGLSFPKYVAVRNGILYIVDDNAILKTPAP